ncbi:hypothetical protein CTAYLR_000716 [Chrysophaeum taylorii]|uniref:VPS9 domain-containing protein n=1 Tax=Chrysophaeum taylorii TaxID=2483200 RepID=A0AAD7XLG1_9STRA|nr:hypothetical protein CTAYLR_000716 [Chrysophaeum taylorii]
MAGEDGWRPEEGADDWTNTTTAYLPFLEWHEYTRLRDVGKTVLAMPFSPFFTLFLGGKGGDPQWQRRRGVKKYVDGEWRADRMYEGRVRTVRYEEGSEAVTEEQRCLLRSEFLWLEARISKKSSTIVERWEVRELRGYVRQSTAVVWRSSGGRERFDSWCASAHERTYSDAVATMFSDSIFGTDVPAAKRVKKVTEYVSPIPPTRVDAALLVDEPPLAAGEKATVEKLPFVMSSTVVTGDGQFTAIDQPDQPELDMSLESAEKEEAPFEIKDTIRLGASAPPWHAFSRARGSSGEARDGRPPRWPRAARRAPGETYEIEFSEPVLGLLQFAELPKSFGTAVVDGRDRKAAARAANGEAPPSIGSAVVSIDGVRVGGLSFAATMGLLDAATVPVKVGFVEASPETLADSFFLDEDVNNGEESARRSTQKRGSCKESDVERALASKEASKLRDQLEEFVASFNKCDLRTLLRSPDRAKRPGPMFWSAVEFASRTLREKRLLAEGDEAYWAQARRILERRVMDRIFDAAMKASTEKDAELSAHLARLRFLRLADLGVVARLAAGSSSSSSSSVVIPEESKPEWTVAQLELVEVSEARTATDALERLASSVRFVASAVEASSNRGKPLAAYNAIGADELLPAITWTVIQANPAKFASVLWFVETYADEQLLRSEMGYAFANVCAAVNFARSTLTSSAPLEGLISKDDFERGVKTAALTHKAVDAAVRRDPRQLRLLFASGADPCGLAVDQSTTPLVAAIDSRHLESITAALEACEQSVAAIDARIVTDKHNVARQGQTALMVGASLGDLETTCALLLLNANPKLVDARGRSAAHLAREARHDACAEALQAGDPRVDPVSGENPLTRACASNDAPKTRGLLLRGADADAVCGKLGVPPLVAAAAAGATECLAALLPHVRDVDSAAKSGAFAGQTALMRSVGLDQDVVRDLNREESSSLVATVVGTAVGKLFPSSSSSQREEEEAARVLAPRGAAAATPDLQVAVATTLLARGSSRTKVDASGRTALRWAESAGGHPRLVAVLRNDPKVDRVFEKARDRRHADVVALLEQGVDPDRADPDKGYTALVAAAYNDDVDLARSLVEPPGDPPRWRAADVNRRGRGGLTPLMYAAQKRSHALVTLLLRHGADREARDDRGRTALDHAETSARATDGSDASTREQLRELLSVDPRKMLLVEAAARDDGAKVAALVAQGASPNECRRIHGADGWHLELATPLIAACAYDARRAATALLDAPGIRVDLANPLGLTPLMYAAHRGSSTMLLMLLRAGASRRRADRSGRTALDWAQRRARADADALRRLSSKRSRQPTAKNETLVDRADRLAVPLLRWDPTKHTAQQLSAEGQVDGVVALVKQGVDVNAIDRTQPHETALLACCATRKLDVLDKLLSHPAIKVDLASSRGVTPLMQAAAAGFEDGVLRLLRANADRYVKTPQGRNAASYASEHAHVSLAAMLEADPETVSIFDLAAQGKLLLIDGLLRQRPDLLNIKRDPDGATPLLLAAANKRLKAVELLLRQPNINVDLSNARRETPLMHAARAGALDIASRLLSKGASSRAKDIDGRNATSWATSRSYSNMMLYLALLSVS